MVFITKQGHKVYPIKDRYSFDKKQVLGHGGQGSVFLATTKYNLTDKLKLMEIGARDSTLMERNPDYKWENAANKKKGVVAVKQMYRARDNKGIDFWWSSPEARFINNMPYHPNLIQYHEMFLDDTSGEFRFTMVMEPMERDLYKTIKASCDKGKKRLTDAFIKNIISQAINGLHHIHKEGYMHRDIKPDNILYSSAKNYQKKKHWYSRSPSSKEHVAKLGDYGLCWPIPKPEQKIETFSGTCGYRAPELMLGNKGYYNEKVDIWAIGVTILDMCNIDLRGQFRRRRHDSVEELEILPILEALGYPSSSSQYGTCPEVTKFIADQGAYHNFSDNKDPVEKWVNDEELKDVVRACLQWDPKKRASAEDLAQMPFFKGTVLNPKDKYDDDD